MVGGYDEDLAKAVLAVLASAYPESLTNTQIKHALSSEPSDRALLTALDALEGDGLICGNERRSSTSGRRELVVMANVKITGEGRKHFAATPIPQHSTIVQGDRNINYGTAGAMGTSSVRTINFQSQWSSLENSVDLKVLAAQLDRLRTTYSPDPESSRKHAPSAGLLAEAEEHSEEGTGRRQWKHSHKWVHTCSTSQKEVGTDLAAKVMAKAMGLDS